MPLVQTRGAASAQGFGEFAQASAPVYIEDVFSTYLYTGNSAGGSTTTVTNNIDLSTKGGLVWIKQRDTGTYDTFGHVLTDSARGITKVLQSNNTNAQQTITDTIASFDTTGFTAGFSGYTNNLNDTYASWTFRKQPKFFDIVTYTGNGAGGRDIAHNLGSAPGVYFVKRTDAVGNWWTGSAAAEQAGGGNPASTSANFALNTTNAYAYTGAPYSVWALASTATTFYVNDQANISSATYVAYLFASNAGGFGLTGLDNVITCGGFTTDGSGNATVSLGYEPQWILLKTSGVVDAWYIYDTMRGITAIGAGGNAFNAGLSPNSSGAENTTTLGAWSITSTGFRHNGGFASRNWIYVAIRRGPMKVPTTGTSVYNAGTVQNNTGRTILPALGYPVDFVWDKSSSVSSWNQFSRLTGGGGLASDSSRAEIAFGVSPFDNNTTVKGDGWAALGDYGWMFRRAPSFMDVVCYTGTLVARTITHNLAAVPELMIVKNRDSTNSGVVYTASGGTGFYLRLFESSSSDSGNTSAGTLWNSTTPTSSVFSLGARNEVNASGLTYVAWLFATCAGVSKVGSYTGTGATQTINCGFTGGARFVLIKKSTSTAPDRNWYVWDTARGMVSGTDPSLKLNTTAAEVNANDVYTITTGFQLVSSSDYVNASGVTYIFLAIA